MSHLSAMMRALLSAVAEGTLYAFKSTATGKITMVGRGQVGRMDIKPLGVKMAMSAGHVVLGEVRGSSKDGKWHQLDLTELGRSALSAAIEKGKNS